MKKKYQKNMWKTQRKRRGDGKDRVYPSLNKTVQGLGDKPEENSREPITKPPSM